LFIYANKAHIGVIPGIDKFIAEYVSAKAMSKDGYLARKGLVALPKSEADAVRKSATALTSLDGALLN
jgi:phosphate transport system substrate-binding protein